MSNFSILCHFHASLTLCANVEKLKEKKNKKQKTKTKKQNNTKQKKNMGSGTQTIAPIKQKKSLGPVGSVL